MNKYKVRQISKNFIKDELTRIDFDNSYLSKAIEKYQHNLIKIYSLSTPAANILKQTALSAGSDLAVSRKVINCSTEYTDGILTVNDKQLFSIIESLQKQPFGLKFLADELLNLYKNINNLPSKFIIRNKSFDWSKQTYIMGILNITPDSFSDGGLYLSIDNAIKKVKEMIENSVDIIDIGAESTKPYSKPTDTDTQINRITPIITEIRKQFPEVVLSIDTRDHNVAQKSIDLGVDIVNDVSGLEYDKEMLNFVCNNNLPIIIVHSNATPDIMQVNPHYNDLIGDITSFFYNKVYMLAEKGVKNIILDPGIGFGKTTEHNLEIIRRIQEFKSLGLPLLVGVSRKKFIDNILNLDVNFREEPTCAVNSYLISQKANILRIHDVKFHAKAMKMLDAIVYNKI